MADKSGNDNILYTLHLLMAEVMASIRLQSLMKGYNGLTRKQGMVLNWLYSQKEVVFQRDLEHTFKLGRSTATELLQQMEKGGLIKRIPMETDGRLKRIELAENALKIRSELISESKKLEEMMVCGIDGSELSRFLAALERMKENLAAANKSKREMMQKGKVLC